MDDVTELTPASRPAPERAVAFAIAPARYVTIKGAACALGLSEGAVRKRIERGIWVLGKQYRKAPDGRIYIDLQAVEKWIESGS